MRQYIRHPSDIPIVVQPCEERQSVETLDLDEFAIHGLSFSSPYEWPNGTVLHIQIPVTSPAFEADGIVAWCKRKDNAYCIAVNFVDRNAQYRLRMVEQICHIQHYQNSLEKKGRKLSNDAAAREWITQYADEFPRPALNSQ